jgi:hypothetical protein
MLLESVDQFSNVIFGVSGGLLSLVGLVALFVALNSQHNVEKARQVLWELQEYSYYKNGTDEEKFMKIRWNLEHYSNLIKKSKPTIYITYLSIITIFFVAVTWSLLVIPHTTNSAIKVFAVISACILFAFIFLLLRLNNIVFIGDLHEFEKLIAVENRGKTGIDVVNLVSKAITCSIVKNDYNVAERYSVSLDIPYQFKTLPYSIKVIATNIIDPVTQFDDHEIIPIKRLEDSVSISPAKHYLTMELPLEVDPFNYQDYRFILICLYINNEEDDNQPDCFFAINMADLELDEEYYEGDYFRPMLLYPHKEVKEELVPVSIN